MTDHPPSTDDRTRRRLLLSTGAVTTAALAGCLGGDDDGEPDEDENDDDPDESETDAQTIEGSSLGTVDIDVRTDQSHTVDVLVEVDGEIEHWSTHDLEANERTVLERDWSNGSTFRITARLDGETFEHLGPQQYSDPDCLDLTIRVLDAETIDFRGDPNGDGCGFGDE